LVKGTNNLIDFCIGYENPREATEQIVHDWTWKIEILFVGLMRVF
jgi:hypothetical protein